MDITEEMRWRSAGFEAQGAEQWRDAYFKPEEAKQWRAAGFSLGEARQWRDVGFGAWEAKQWRAAKFGASNARELANQGRTPESAARLRKQRLSRGAAVRRGQASLEWNPVTQSVAGPYVQPPSGEPQATL